MKSVRASLDAMPAALLAAGLLVGAPAGARNQAATPDKAPVTIEVRGDDFPVLVHETGLPPPLDENGLPRTPGCEAVRARRVDELPYPWREAVDRIRFDCQPLGEADELISLDVSALLLPGRVWLAGHPVAEIHLMDSELYGDHQYIVTGRYQEVATDMRTHVETQCQLRAIREEVATPIGCVMTESADQLYLETNEVGGIWIHADPDDASRTIYSEAWAD
ncbi:hypothetical protein [Pseudoxanthomonas indica]|uniref:Secreted protein n=1 Tax=Pseudoxanthomonas indica TaxID=428993 RepID=A0A1T5LJR4_9GAMM|nr:hypothetical protein [Pseudoxanthomonas indica]GGD36055.1 hypothetical protein GCM10007235_05070 [Pseudoxanthomonas indica]SKC76202.1 hypothetical protein SAMN06296058_2632 [Pseudoxanthomonas indica]